MHFARSKIPMLLTQPATKYTHIPAQLFFQCGMWLGNSEENKAYFDIQHISVKEYKSLKILFQILFIYL